MARAAIRLADPGAVLRLVRLVGPSWAATVLGHGPIGCYFTRVRADNRWLRARGLRLVLTEPGARVKRRGRD